MLYIATARCFDDEMARRIELHRQARPAHWTTAEACRGLDGVLDAHPQGDVLLDCVSNMVTNLMLDEEPDYDDLPMARIEEIERGIQRECGLLLDGLRRREGLAVLVTNEVGLSLVPPTAWAGCSPTFSGGSTSGWPPRRTRCSSWPAAFPCA